MKLYKYYIKDHLSYSHFEGYEYLLLFEELLKRYFPTHAIHSYANTYFFRRDSRVTSTGFVQNGSRPSSHQSVLSVNHRKDLFTEVATEFEILCVLFVYYFIFMSMLLLLLMFVSVLKLHKISIDHLSTQSEC